MSSPHPAAGPRALRKFGRCGGLWLTVLAWSAIALPTAAYAEEPSAGFRASQSRVAAVAHRLVVANPARCDAKLAPQPGSSLRNDHHHHHELAADLHGRVLDHQLAALNECLANVVLVEDNAINAWADGSGIRITTGLLARCRSDADLALVLGHELAHNLLQHRQRLAGGGGNGLLPAGKAESQDLHDAEEEADRFAVDLALAARYDLTGAVDFMDGLLDRSIVESETHPGPERRLALLREAIAQARSGQALPAG